MDIIDAVARFFGASYYGAQKVCQQIIGADLPAKPTNFASSMDEDEKGASPIYGFNPETRRYVLKNGPTWARLVKRGAVQDAALVAAWAEAKEATRQGQVARAKEARALGLGICGGVLPEATRHIVPKFRAGEPGSRGAGEPGSRGALPLLRNIALENREALCREDITREEAEELLRKAYMARLGR